MGDNPHNSPTDNAPRTHPFKLFLQLVFSVTYGLLYLLILFTVLFWLFLGAFITQFTIENKTDRPITVTPVGTVGKQGDRHALPIYMWRFPPIPSPQRGGFNVGPGESIDIYYDMDNINFSEIVVHDSDSERGQLVVNPNPTEGQYHAPATKHFVIDDLSALAAVPEPVQNAERDAQIASSILWKLYAILFGPLIALIFLLLVDYSFGISEHRRQSDRTIPDDEVTSERIRAAE